MSCPNCNDLDAALRAALEQLRAVRSDRVSAVGTPECAEIDAAIGQCVQALVKRNGRPVDQVPYDTVTPRPRDHSRPDESADDE